MAFPGALGVSSSVGTWLWCLKRGGLGWCFCHWGYWVRTSHHRCQVEMDPWHPRGLNGYRVPAPITPAQCTDMARVHLPRIFLSTDVSGFPVVDLIIKPYYNMWGCYTKTLYCWQLSLQQYLQYLSLWTWGTGGTQANVVFLGGVSASSETAFAVCSNPWSWIPNSLSELVVDPRLQNFRRCTQLYQHCL